MIQENYLHTSDSQAAVSSEISDDQIELERILRIVAHGFEGGPEVHRPRLQSFVDCFCTCSNVLDIGCGEGIMLELLRDAGKVAIGVDIDPSKVAAAHSKGLEAIVARADEYLQDKKGEFDGVFLSHIIEHFDGPDAVRLLYLCRKAMRPGGTIVVITPHFMHSQVATQIFWLDVTHKRPYPQLLLQHIFAALGIAVVGCGVREMGLDLAIIGKVPK